MAAELGGIDVQVRWERDHKNGSGSWLITQVRLWHAIQGIIVVVCTYLAAAGCSAYEVQALAAT